jgi:hypothetical protein
MQTGWKQIDGVWYYFNGSGAMQTGWIQENGKWYYLESNGVWNPNAVYTGLSRYEGYWSNVELPKNNDLTQLPTHMSAFVDFTSGNQASVGVAFSSKGFVHYAEASGTVTFQNNKAVLYFDEDGWSHSGKAEFTLKNNKVYLNISINPGGSGAWGIPSGQYTLAYHYDLGE